MASNKYTVGRRYGRALFELAEEEQILDNVFQDVVKLGERYQATPELEGILSNPKVPLVEKEALLGTLLQGMEEILQQTVFVVMSNHRLTELQIILKSFEEAYYEEKSILKATATTVVPLTVQQKEQLAKKLQKQFHYKEVELDEVIDPSILGGVILETHNQIMDGSVKKRLESIRRALSK
ncbi:ATP synthase F1 subunit delta [Enterococcus sp. LJL98]